MSKQQWNPVYTCTFRAEVFVQIITTDYINTIKSNIILASKYFSSKKKKLKQKWIKTIQYLYKFMLNS